MACVKVFLLTNTGTGEASPPERKLILTHFSHVTIFSRVQNFAILQIFKFFAKTNYTRKTKSKYDSDFSVYVDIKSLSFPKILLHKCSKEVKKLIYNTKSSSC